MAAKKVMNRAGIMSQLSAVGAKAEQEMLKEEKRLKPI